jgi:hypothetical protein
MNLETHLSVSKRGPRSERLEETSMTLETQTPVSVEEGEPCTICTLRRGIYSIGNTPVSVQLDVGDNNIQAARNGMSRCN